ncbi:MAG TPA: serine hydrolase [Planctomycetaceae bacterium]|jgi:CubicO group peptidase (beta-lactamase class C family)
MRPSQIGLFAAVLLHILCLVAACHGQELPTAAPEEVGLSAQKLARIRPAIQTMIDRKNVAGALTLVARHGKVVYVEAVGLCDVDARKPMQDDTIFRIYSMTKPVTSTAVMMLFDDGKIELDASASKYLPELEGLKVFVKSTDNGPELEDAKREITIRDLLRHTSGLTYGIFGATPVDEMYKKARVLDPADTLADMTKKLGQIPLLYQPGTKWHYSVSDDVLARIVEVVSGKPFDEFLDERICRPLDMRDTGFYVPPDKLDRFAVNYGPKTGGGLSAIDAPKTSSFRKRPPFLSGGGGLVSTARDYARFCQMFVNGGELFGKRLLKTETVQMMIRNQLPESAVPINFGGIKLDGIGFGLGFSVRVSKNIFISAHALGEYGWSGVASTHFWIAPHDELIVIALQQYTPFSPMLELAIKPLVYAAIVE